MNDEPDNTKPNAYEVHQSCKDHLISATAYRVRESDQILTFYSGDVPTHVFRDWDYFRMLQPTPISDKLVE